MTSFPRYGACPHCGGRIFVTSHAAPGDARLVCHACLTVVAATADAPADAPAAGRPALAPQAAEPGIRGLRVLVVEDDPIVAWDLAAALEASGATVVGPFPSVRQGLAAACGETLDGAVLDVSLPDGPAYPIVDRLRGRGVPCLFATGYVNRIFPEAYRTVPLLRKPVRPEKLRRLAAQVFARAPSRASA